MEDGSATDGAAINPITRELWIKGLPSLSTYLSYCESNAEEPKLERQALIAEWTDASAAFERMQTTQAGAPDDIASWPLEDSLAPLVSAITGDARFRNSLGSVPTRFAWVELDKLVVSQKHVDLHYVERLQARLGDARDAEALFNFALPLKWSEAPVEIRKNGSGRYLLISKSADFRFHAARMFRPDQIVGYESFGAMAAVLGLVVGFGSNFLNVIEGNKRMVIHDGHHRAFALRALGVTHAPCIVQSVRHRDELSVFASNEISGSSSFYFDLPRPPMLVDFFDPELRKEMLVRRTNYAIEFEYKVREYEFT